MRICSLLVANRVREAYRAFQADLSRINFSLLFCFGSAYPIINRNQKIFYSLRESILKFPMQTKLYGCPALRRQRHIISCQCETGETVVLFKSIQRGMVSHSTVHEPINLLSGTDLYSFRHQSVVHCFVPVLLQREDLRHYRYLVSVNELYEPH